MRATNKHDRQLEAVPCCRYQRRSTLAELIQNLCAHRRTHHLTDEQLRTSEQKMCRDSKPMDETDMTKTALRRERSASDTLEIISLIVGANRVLTRAKTDAVSLTFCI